MDLLQTKRAFLRRFKDTDLENMLVLETDPDVMKFTPSRIPQTLEKTKARLQSLIEKESNYGPIGVWAVETKDSGEFVGWFMLVKTEFVHPEIGFMIAKAKWGKGYATEVARALIDFGLNTLKYPGIAAVTDHDNMISIHILEKLGFKKIGSKMKFDKILNREIETYIFELRESASGFSDK